MLMPESTANIWLQDEADCNEPTGRQEPPDKENKQKQEQEQKRS
jgi:hypothetical protein